MLTKEINCTAAVAWAPASSQATRLVTGTLAGAMDASFSTSAELEVHEVNLADRDGTGVARLGGVSSSSRYASGRMTGRWLMLSC
jgi:protein transport protein SEC31